MAKERLSTVVSATTKKEDAEEGAKKEADVKADDAYADAYADAADGEEEPASEMSKAAAVAVPRIRSRSPPPVLSRPIRRDHTRVARS